MTDSSLQALEHKLDQLIREAARLSQENASLRQQAEAAQQREADWQVERSRLVEKNDLARSRVEAMITRLKSLEEQN